MPLSQKTTFKIGGTAKFFVIAPTKQSMVKLISALDYIQEKYVIIGNGSNILASDEHYDGVVIKCGFTDIIQNGNFVYADAGVPLPRLSTYARVKGLSGLEWSCAIPATVGGAVYMNAGAHGGQIADNCVCVDIIIEGKLKTITADKLKFSYRSSIFHKKKWLILGAYFYLKRDEPTKIQSRENEFRITRIKNLPLEPSAGSTFKKPNPEFYVGKVIEELGLKGLKYGGAQISDKHAGVIVNTGGATKRDVMELVKIVKQKVYEKYGVRLQLEYKEI